jgi:hypothetical protein
MTKLSVRDMIPESQIRLAGVLVSTVHVTWQIYFSCLLANIFHVYLLCACVLVNIIIGDELSSRTTSTRKQAGATKGSR